MDDALLPKLRFSELVCFVPGHDGQTRQKAASFAIDAFLDAQISNSFQDGLSQTRTTSWEKIKAAEHEMEPRPMKAFRM